MGSSPASVSAADVFDVADLRGSFRIHSFGAAARYTARRAFPYLALGPAAAVAVWFRSRSTGTSLGEFLLMTGSAVLFVVGLFMWATLKRRRELRRLQDQGVLFVATILAPPELIKAIAGSVRPASRWKSSNQVIYVLVDPAAGWAFSMAGSIPGPLHSLGDDVIVDFECWPSGRIFAADVNREPDALAFDGLGAAGKVAAGRTLRVSG